MNRLVTVIIGIALLVPSAAFAQEGSSCQAYNPQLCSVAHNAKAQQTAGSADASTLPFTGLDVGLLAGGGGVLIGAGLMVRRLSRSLN